MNYPLLPILFLLLLACNDTQDQVVHQDFILIQQTGDPYSDGFLHGSTCKGAIELQLASWAKHMEAELGLNKDSFHNIIHLRTGFLDAIQATSPDLLREIDGIAAGAGVDRELILAMNLGEEIYTYAQRPIEHCSNLAVKSPSGNLLTYNQDLPLFLHGNNKPVILQHPDALIFAMPGTIGISGVSRVAAISCNSLPMLKMDEKGLPLSFALRQMLAMKSYDLVREYILNTPMAVPQNLLLASAEEVVSFEISRQEVVEIVPGASPYVFHTNFPIRSRNFKNADRPSTVCSRYEALNGLTQQLSGEKEVTAIALELGFSEAPLTNRDTYLRFTSTFSPTPATPVVRFINPRRSGMIHFLNF